MLGFCEHTFGAQDGEAYATREGVSLQSLDFAQTSTSREYVFGLSSLFFCLHYLQGRQNQSPRVEKKEKEKEKLKKKEKEKEEARISKKM